MEDKWIHLESLTGCSLMVMFGVIHDTAKEVKELLGLDFEWVGIVREGELNIWYEQNKWNQTAEALIDKINTNPGFGEAMNAGLLKGVKSLDTFSKQLKKTDVKTLSNKQLGMLYSDFYYNYRKCHSSGMLQNILDMDSGQFTNKLTNIVEEKIAEKQLDMKAQDIFGTLTTSCEKTQATLEQIELLEIAGKAAAEPTALQHFKAKSESEILWKLAKDLPEIDKAITEHTEKFGGIFYLFEGPAWGKEMFVKRIKNLIDSGIDPRHEIKNMKDGFERVEKEIEELEEKLGFDEKQKRIFGITRDIIVQKGLRKEVMYQAYHAVEPLQKEIGKRLNLNISQVRAMTVEEVAEALEKGGFDKKLVDERVKLGLVYYDEGMKCVSGKEAEAFIKQNNLVMEEPEPLEELSGACAYGGLASGKVKIVNTYEDVAKMDEGDILVSHSTQPDLVSAMKKASAIVTDMGGMTCHAAIVSRELMIPCVIGTKVATKSLKDGDFVKVNATEGTVKKVKGNE